MKVSAKTSFMLSDVSKYTKERRLHYSPPFCQNKKEDQKNIFEKAFV